MMNRQRAFALLCAAVWIALPSAQAQEEKVQDPSRMLFQYTRDVTAPSYEAASRGLAFLATRQNADGSWNGSVGFKLNQDYEVIEDSAPHAGVTALAGIAFLSGGHLPDRGRYARTISKCIEFVVESVGETGFITAHNTRMYSHAFATLFLAEVLGMTDRKDLRPKLQKAVDMIVECQNHMGSWRYEPFAPESDMSITVCQLMALRAARNIGIKVPRSTIDRAVEYVRNSYVGAGSPYLRSARGMNSVLYRTDPYYSIEEGSFLYQIVPDEMSGYLRSSFSLTAAGIVSLYNAGRYSEKQIQTSLDYLLRKNDALARPPYRHHYFYWYGHYYAVQAMYIAGGRYWEVYYPKIRRELIESQRAKGFWDNYEGPGENFATAVAVIILQIPYNYLPIFQR